MPVATLSAVRFGHGTRILLDDVSLSIESGEKIGLVGRNGFGKTTLMRMLAGELPPDTGSASVTRGARVAFLTQDPRLDPADTLRSSVARAFERISQIQSQLESIYDALATADGDELERLMARQSTLEHELEQAGGYAVDHRIDAVLHGLGFEDVQFGIPVSSLSGGQRARAGLARLLLEEPDLLLLDEPTNHLDIAGRRWLEGFLADEFKGAVVVVSHDRWLLNAVASRIIEIHDAALRDYPGNYEDFVALRRERTLTQLRQHAKQQDRIAREQAFIDRYRAGQRARQAKGRQTRLERFRRDELIERPQDFDVMRLQLPRAAPLGDIVVSAEGLSKTLGERTLFRELELTIAPGERLGVIGPNGAGKTTFVRTLLGELEADCGIIKRSPRLSAGWFRQTHEHLDLSLAVWEYLRQTVPPRANGLKLNEQEARDLAGAFLFSGSAQESRLGALSGGERVRAILAGLVAGAHNLLVLDEPSNHLDIPSAERLEQALSLPPEEGGYDGALILISHDRALLESTCDRILCIEGDGTWTLFNGDYAEYEASREAASKASAAPAAPAPPQPERPAERPRKPNDRNPAASSAPRRKGPHTSLSQEELESRIAAAESRIATIDQLLADPATFRDRARSASLLDERTALIARKSSLEEEWLARES